jgi:hypothetical protein
MTGFRRHAAFHSFLQFVAGLLGLAATIAAAAEPREVARETREFKVSVDGKGRGKCTIEISRREDGSDSMHIDAALRFNYVVYDYRYSSAGTEVWKDGRLIRLENAADYNGTKYVVRARADRTGLRLTVNDVTSQIESDVWVTSYWRLPDRLAQAGEGSVVPTGGRRPARESRTITIPLLDSDKGRTLSGEVKRIGEETVTVAGRKEPCTHFKITGDVQVDVWYDADRRLVRQESLDSGHKTVMELTRIAR